MSILDEIKKRRTFAIVSHPDAGKTTLTEKLLLFGGAIQEAGAVKSNKIKRHATSDFMEIERQRGISVATSVMAFEYNDLKINILDTPGHQDFAEDTYRTLTAVDSAIVVIDVAKGVETQTEKLVEVCRMRKTPMIVFINKLDREGRDGFELLDEIEEKLGLNVCPLSWPIGMGQRFKGVYNLYESKLNLFQPHGLMFLFLDCPGVRYRQSCWPLGLSHRLEHERCCRASGRVLRLVFNAETNGADMQGERLGPAVIDKVLQRPAHSGE